MFPLIIIKTTNLILTIAQIVHITKCYRYNLPIRIVKSLYKKVKYIKNSDMYFIVALVSI